VAEGSKYKEEKKKNLKKDEFKVNKLFSSAAYSLTPQHTAMMNTCYDL
jgi:hypothetical protein